MDELSLEQGPDQTPDQASTTQAIIPQQAEPPADPSVDPPVDPPVDPSVPASQSAPVLPEAPVKIKRKRSISTPALCSLMIVIGLVGGIGAGYAVQDHRTPTALPSLAVAQPKYPQSALFTGQLPVMLPSAQDDATITDGDLTKVLLPTPSGATANYDHVWMTLADSASFCTVQSTCFDTYLNDDVSRIADTSWTLGNGTYVEVRISQYAEGSSGTLDQLFSTFSTPSGDQTLTPPPGFDVMAYEFVNTSNDNANTDYAEALHGNLLVEFWVVSGNAAAPDPSIINGLITQQLARL